MELQRASTWKRMAAWILDVMLLLVVAAGAISVFSAIFRYDDYSRQYQEAYDHYASAYGVDVNITQEDIDAMTPEEQAAYKEKCVAAGKAMASDNKAMKAYNMVINLALLMTTLGILLGVLILEFLVPLILKNGQTIGKKCFALGVVRIDGVKMNTLQLFARTVLGKYTVETMIPVYVVFMLLFNSIDITGTILILGLVIAQAISVLVTRNRSALHDLLAGTVVVDIASQRVFESTEELVEYTKRIHAEQAQRQAY